MRVFTSLFQILAVIVLIGGALLALTSGSGFGADRPNDAALLKGEGVLDGLTFTTVLAPLGKPGEIRDAMRCSFVRGSCCLWNARTVATILPRRIFPAWSKAAMNLSSRHGVRQKMQT